MVITVIFSALFSFLCISSVSSNSSFICKTWTSAMQPVQHWVSSEGRAEMKESSSWRRTGKRKKEDLLLDHSLVPSFNALLLTAVCSQTQVPLSISWGSSSDTCLPSQEASQMMSLASPSALQELELFLPWISMVPSWSVHVAGKQRGPTVFGTYKKTQEPAVHSWWR